jgi:hypothetical protein
VVGVFAAAAAISGEFQLLSGVDLVFFGDVILRFTYRTNEGKILTSTFFGHGLQILPYSHAS